MSELGTEHNGQLKSIVERIENIEETICEHRVEQKEIYSEAKSGGYDVQTLRTLIRLRKLSLEDAAEREALLNTYKHALGMG